MRFYYIVKSTKPDVIMRYPITEEQQARTRLGQRLHSSPPFKILEIVLVFAVGLGIVYVLTQYTTHLVLKQAIIWLANVVMMLLIWLGLRLRGQKVSDFGVTFKSITAREGLKTFLLSLLTFVLAALGFVTGSIIMANITGIPEGADMSSYEYLDNVFMLMLTLFGVYVVSSFGEEFIYRAFLVNRFSELSSNSKPARAISLIASAIVFGLVHYEWGPMGMVQTGFMGLALGYCYLRFKKRLWILVLAHAYMDTILMIQVYVSNR